MIEEQYEIAEETWTLNNSKSIVESHKSKVGYFMFAGLALKSNNLNS